MQDAISLLKEAEREIFRLQDAWSSTKESDALRKKIRKFVAAQQKFAPDEATATVKCISCDNDIPRPICQSCL